jgi:hypothetical protein
VVTGALAGAIVGGLAGRRIAESIHPTTDVEDEGARESESEASSRLEGETKPDELEGGSEYRGAYRDQPAPHAPIGPLGAMSRSTAKLDQAKATLQAYEAWNNIIAPPDKGSHTTIDVLSRLVRSEYKAVETYRRAIETLGHEPGIDHIAAEHREAAEILEQEIYDRGDTPPGYSGLWGAWMRAASEPQANNRLALLSALREGEESEIENYAEALQNSRLDPECQTLIHDRLLPQTQQHLETLDRILDDQE